MNQTPYAQTQAQRDWDRARQGAIVEDLISVFTGENTDLLSFDEVKQRLRLNQKNYRGLQEIEVSRIRGSVGRYQDFTRTFLPRKTSMGERWRRVSAVAMDLGVPPVEVYQVGEAYFVLDGNHRVSIARQSGQISIQANVWEYQTPVGLSADANLDEVFIRQEYKDFLEHTRLADLRPDQNIEFTAPGRYRELEYQIGMYKLALEKIDEEPLEYEYAVTAWYDMIYEPSVQIIKERGVMARFPERTRADLFIWVWRYHQELQARGIKSLAQAADEIRESGSDSLPRRLWRAVVNRLK